MRPQFLKPKSAVDFPPLDQKTVTWLVLMHVGCLFAPFTFTWGAFWVAVVLYWMTAGLGISLCYHRLLSHRSFKTPKWVEYFLTILGCLSAQRSPIYWVARHKVHHAHADTQKDPHTPLDGFLWSHMIWPMADIRVEDENEFYRRHAPELANDPGHRWIQKTHEIWPQLLAVGLLIVGGLPFLIWGLCVRSVAVYHATWIVNSAGHLWGYKNYQIKDNSRNSPWLAVPSFGDSWHNNHHAFPGLARHGHRWWEFDLSYYTVKAMSWVGLASDIRATLPKSKNTPPPTRPEFSKSPENSTEKVPELTEQSA